MRTAFLITCEHAGNDVPEDLAHLFAGHADVLASHRGWDPGALAVARVLAKRLDAPLVTTSVSRLVVDTNRSPSHPDVFSEFTRDSADRDGLRARFHAPHHAAVRAALRGCLARAERVVHIASHSFTPIWNGAPRGIDVGLLYDPRRTAERSFAAHWRDALRSTQPTWRVRRNAPYRGVADGLPTLLRRENDGARYLGFELELSQGMLADGDPAQLGNTVAGTIEVAAAR